MSGSAAAEEDDWVCIMDWEITIAYTQQRSPHMLFNIQGHFEETKHFLAAVTKSWGQ